MNKSLQFIISLVLLVVLLYTTGNKSWIRLSYEINKLEIIEKFCINKEETKFKCEGKCHLKTQLEESEAPNPTKNANIIEEESLTLFHFNFQSIAVKNRFIPSSFFESYQLFYSFFFLNSIFHPPQ